MAIEMILVPYSLFVSVSSRQVVNTRVRRVASEDVSHSVNETVDTKLQLWCCWKCADFLRNHLCVSTSTGDGKQTQQHTGHFR